MKRWPASLLVPIMRGYQLFISPLLGSRCRFHPICSYDAIDALRTQGALQRSWLTLLRVVRRHPLHPGGHDPVPPGCSDARVGGG